MKNTLLLSMSFLLLSSSRAQTANTFFAGANILNAREDASTGRAAQSLQVKAGLFVSGKTALGLCLEAGINSNKSTPYGITLFSRFQTGDKALHTLRFFVEAGAGIADHSNKTEAAGIAPKNWMKPTVYLSPGLSIYPCDMLSIELAPEYRHITGQQAVNRLGMSLGFKFFIAERKFKELFPEKFHSLY